MVASLCRKRVEDGKFGMRRYVPEKTEVTVVKFLPLHVQAKPLKFLSHYRGRLYHSRVSVRVHGNSTIQGSFQVFTHACIVLGCHLLLGFPQTPLISEFTGHGTINFAAVNTAAS